MPANEKLSIQIAEIRHKGGTLQFPFTSPDTILEGVVTATAGNEVPFKIAAGDIEAWAATQEGISAKVATLTLPPITLERLFTEPGFRKELTIGAVSDHQSLFQEARIAGCDGTIFSKEDVRSAIEGQDIDAFFDLTEEEQERFLDENWWEFVYRIGNRLSEAGNSYIDERVAEEFEDRLAAFKSERAGPAL